MENGYYKTLNVDKHSSIDEVKRKYKLLALKYHPDRETGDAEAFKKVNEAYEHIINKINQDKENDDIVDSILKQYDHQAKEPSLHIDEDIWPSEVNLDIGDILFGCSKAFVIKRTLDCENCSGTGIDNPEMNTIQCRECKGKGTHPRMDFLSCTSCNGKGRFVMNNKRCKGLCNNGKVYQESQFMIDIDPNTKHNSHIKVSHTEVVLKHKYRHHYDGYSLKLEDNTVVAKISISILELLCGFSRKIMLGHYNECFHIHSNHAFDTHKEIKQAINDHFKLIIRFKVVYNKEEKHLYEKIGRSMRKVLSSQREASMLASMPSRGEASSPFQSTEEVSSTPLPNNKVVDVHQYHRDDEQE